MAYFEIFIYLQILDFLTTMVGLHIGLAEASPFIRWLMGFGPTAGVVASKILAFVLAGVCIWLNKRRLISLINYWYAGLVAWNIVLILSAVRA